MLAAHLVVLAVPAPAQAQRRPPKTAPAPKKPAKKDVALEEARKREEERRKEEEAQRAAAQRQLTDQRAEEARKIAKAAEAAALVRQSRTSFDEGRRYLNESKRERRRADDEIAAERVAASRGFLALPILFYSPETNLGLGAFGLYYFHLGEPDKTRTSNIRSSFIYTTKKQALFDIGPTLWFAENRLNVNALFTYDYYPNFFAGIGNRTPSTLIENYAERFPSISTQVQYRLVSSLYAGIRYRYERRAILDTEPGRALDSGTILGDHGGVLSGLGVTVSFDSRDNIDAPAVGTYAYLGVRQNFAAIGSDYRFTEVDVDLRKYFGIGDNVLAFQILGGTNAGNTPFYALSTIGGGSNLRGITFGRYRDTHLIEGQAEFRFPIFGRWSGAAFGGAGEVMHSVLDFKPGGLHPAGGVGLRFAIVPSERLRIRLDFAYAEAGLAYYLNIGEAF